MTVTVADYQRAERDLTLREAGTAVRVHAIVTAAIWVLVVLLNLTVAAGFPWSIFAIGGTAIGLCFHWYGYRHTEADLARRQQRVEEHARTLVHS